MPRQTTGVKITDNGDGTVTVEIPTPQGTFGDTMNVADLFDRSLDTDHIKDNCRLAFQLGNIAQLDTDEFVNAVNRTNKGLEAGFGNVTILKPIKLVDVSGEGYHLDFKINTGAMAGQTFGIDVSLDEMRADPQDTATIKRNLRSFLRVGKFNTLTQGAIAQIRAASFWF